jgi:hypothetical protein
MIMARSVPPVQVGEAAGSVGALYCVVTPVLIVVVWSAGAHRADGGVNDAAPPVMIFQVGCPATVQVTFGQWMRDHHGCAR